MHEFVRVGDLNGDMAERHEKQEILGEEQDRGQQRIILAGPLPIGAVKMNGAANDVAQQQRDQRGERSCSQIMAQVVFRFVEEIGERNADESRKSLDDSVDRLR